MCNLVENSDNYLKASGSLWQYCRDEPTLANNGDITDSNEGNVSSSFNFKEKISG